MHDGAPVLGRGPPELALGEGDDHIIFQRECLAQIAVAQGIGRGGECLPRQHFELDLERLDLIGVRIVVYMLAWIDGVEREPGGYADVDVLPGLEVVGVGAEPLAPPLLKDRPRGIVHDVIRRAPRALHLADGLLGQERDESGAADGVDMPGRGQSQPVATAGRCGQPDHPGRGVGEGSPQSHRIGVVQRTGLERDSGMAQRDGARLARKGVGYRAFALIEAAQHLDFALPAQ